VRYGHEQSEKLTVTVTFTGSAPAPAGPVTVKAGSVLVCSVKLAAGRGSCTLTPSELTAGTYRLVAAYGGSASFGAATSPVKTLTIARA
jgi:hypothetical protein